MELGPTEMPSQGGAAPGRQAGVGCGVGGGCSGRKRQVLLGCAVHAECWREGQLYGSGGDTLGLPLLRSLGLTNKEVVLPVVQRHIWGDMS